MQESQRALADTVDSLARRNEDLQERYARLDTEAERRVAAELREQLDTTRRSLGEDLLERVEAIPAILSS